MKAIVQTRYGRPSRVLSVQEVAPPPLADDGVLVRVADASLNAMDWHLVTGRPLVARFSFGVRRPKRQVVGSDLAGVVESVGAAVTEFRPGDAVFGRSDGAFAELATTRQGNLARKPAALSFADVAALPVAGITALQAVRDRGGLKPAESVLVLGAGGGVRSFAVQIAVADGGRVTAVTGPATLDLVRSLGAHRVVDRTAEDVLRGRERFDLVIDAGGFASAGQLARLLTPSGRAVIVGAGDSSSAGLVVGMVGTRIRSRLTGRPIGTFLAQVSRERLDTLAGLAADGRLRVPVVDTVPLDGVPVALDALLDGRARGKTVVEVARV